MKHLHPCELPNELPNTDPECVCWVVKAERERIINLIEKQGTWEASIHIGGKTIDDLVELIRNSK